MKPSRIFITHSSHDSATATEIRDYLEANGIQCWMAPRDIPIGEEWAKGILNGINTASGMLLVFSSNSNDSSQVRREIERAIHNDIPIYPVRIEDVQPSDAMEYYISSNHWMDAFGDNIDANLSKLVAAIKIKQSSDLESRHSTDHVVEEPVQDEPTQVPTSSADKGQQPPNRKFSFPKLSLKIPRKIAIPIVFLLLTVAVFFLIRSLGSSNLITTITEELPTDTISSFVRMIASTDEFNDYVSGIKVTEDGNYVIMGYSYVNDYERKPWIAMYDILGNEMWRHEGSINGGEGEFDICPDGRIVWAYSVVDTTLVNNRGFTLYTKECIASNGEVAFSETSRIGSSSEFFGRKINIHTQSFSHVVQVHSSTGKIFIRSVSFFGLEYYFDDEKDLYIIGEEGHSGFSMAGDLITTEYVLSEDSFVERNSEIADMGMFPFVSNIEFDDGGVYWFSLMPNSPSYLITFNSLVRYGESGDRLLSEELRSYTYCIFQTSTFLPLNLPLILIPNDSDEYYLIFLLPDNDIHCIKVDSEGNEIWYEKFGTPSNDDNLISAVFIEDALYLYGQVFSRETGNYDGYLLKINQEGDILWETTYDLGSDESINGVELTVDGGLVMVISSCLYGTDDVYLVKTDSYGSMPKYDVSGNTILYENWSSTSSIQEKWSAGGDWNTSGQNEFGENSCLNLRDDIVVYITAFSSRLALSISSKLGASGYVNRGGNHYLRMGVLGGAEDIIGNRLFLGKNPDNWTEFKNLFRYVNDAQLYYEDGAWFHWDYGENSSFESCGRIGVGYFNGDSIVVGKIEPDTAWVEYSVLNDLKIKLDGNSAVFYINDSLFFHTDDFVSDSDSLYLYLGGASSTLPHAIGEVMVTSE
ncbi:MAG: toll/interleukin-1 receptor domain-containing protein [Candidatus Sabulitectum sp.]|nr:toll/interleukin-1 receptor domain-containing protein [Candidatus Sabulitectum sp.]